jgi:hypothetical protein
MENKEHDPGKHSACDPLRRHFLKATGTAGAGVAFGFFTGALESGQRAPSRTSSEAKDTAKGSDTGADKIPMRPFGKTGVKVSALGVGGHHLGEFHEVKDALRLIDEAIDAGLTFFDNCWEYVRRFAV